MTRAALRHRLLRGARAAGISARDLSLAGWSWPSAIAEAIASHPNEARQERYAAAMPLYAPLCQPVRSR